MYRNLGKKMLNHGPMMDGEKYYPRIEFTIEQLPEIGTWAVGETYEVKIKVKQVSHEIEEYEGEQCESADFEVIAVEAYDAPLTDKQQKALDKLGMK